MPSGSDLKRVSYTPGTLGPGNQKKPLRMPGLLRLEVWTNIEILYWLSVRKPYTRNYEQKKVRACVRLCVWSACTITFERLTQSFSEFAGF